MPDSVRFDPNKLAGTLIRTADGKPLPVSEVASMERANGQGELRRENLRPMAVVSGRLEGRDLGSAVDEIRSKLDQLKLPIGYTYEIGGQYQSQGQAFRELLMVFALAVLLVFTILVMHFRAWVPAILILLAAPLSLGGALLLLWIAGIDLNISSAMGLILLVGLVVKNGIMLLDFSEKLHAEGEPFEAAIAHAGRIRLRPILDDDLLHPVRSSSPGVGSRRRCGAAEAARPRGHRRTCAVHARHASRRSGSVRRNQSLEVTRERYRVPTINMTAASAQATPKAWLPLNRSPSTKRASNTVLAG